MLRDMGFCYVNASFPHTSQIECLSEYIYIYICRTDKLLKPLTLKYFRAYPEYEVMNNLDFFPLNFFPFLFPFAIKQFFYKCRRKIQVLISKKKLRKYLFSKWRKGKRKEISLIYLRPEIFIYLLVTCIYDTYDKPGASDVIATSFVTMILPYL